MSRSITRGICAICRSQHRLIPSTSSSPFRLFHSSPPTPIRRDSRSAYSPGPPDHRRRSRTPVAPPRLSPADFKPSPPPSPLHIIKTLLTRVPEWIESERTRNKLPAYGLTDRQAEEALSGWKGYLQDSLGLCGNDQDAMKALEGGDWDIGRLRDGLGSEEWVSVYEASLLRHFLTRLVTHPPRSVPVSIIDHMKAILAETDLSRLPFTSNNLPARTLSRHFHLHVGPTNSGKTYSALKALARAPTGAYAGPLRLLAHEVWERLNLGTVGGLDGVGRACNLLTGEERRIVDEDSGLISCTVEMLPFTTPTGEAFDVVVIDEIQMMGDPQRGGSWTSAVLGVKAKEVHLCGDETTVNLLSSLIPTLGDQMTIHRYERLTPLAVADKSLESDWNKVEPGDCVVTFSRTNIFSVKKLIEQTAGRKCAVVYGALPPETRAEQAREFNEGRAEVLVASDAVGMGLNLKIKRMIFESLHKFNGKVDIPLPLTQVKQIAGRAGRFGMHKTVPALDADTADAPTPGGEVTTLHSADLPILRQLLPLPLPSLPRATLDIPFEVLSSLSSLLPQSSTYADLLDHLHHLVLPPNHTTLGSTTHKVPLADVVEAHRDRLTLDEVELFCYSPVNVRDPVSVQIFRNVVASYAELGHVYIEDTFGPSRLIDMLKRCEATLATLPPPPPVYGIGKRPLVPPILISSIPLLETLHKSLVFYIWLSFRFPIAFPDRPLAQSIKERTESVLEQCLERLPGLRNKKTSERTKESDGAVARWRRENVAPDGKMWGFSEKIKAEKRHFEKVGGGGAGSKVEWKGKEEGERRRRKELWSGVGVVSQDRPVV